MIVSVQVVMKQTGLPISLLQEKSKVHHSIIIIITVCIHYYYLSVWGIVSVSAFIVVDVCLLSQHARFHLLDTESFEDTFGPKSQRKKPRMTTMDVEVSQERRYTFVLLIDCV